MKILVTGGLGFVGVHLLPRLEQDSTIERVFLLDNLCYTAIPSVLQGLSDKFTFIQGDVRAGELVTELVQDADTVINLAAQTFVDSSINDSMPFITTNIYGTVSVMEAIRKCGCRQRLIHTSTDEVWGEVLDGKFDEDSPYQPRNPYSATKASADHLIKAYGNTYGLKYNIVHFSNLYGRWQYPEKLIPITIARLLRGEKAIINGTGQHVRTWLHVNDAVDALMKILHHAKSRTYALGTDEEFTNIEVVRLICRLMGKDDNAIEFAEDRPGDDFRYAISYAKISQELGWHPTTRFEDGIADIISWFISNPDWWKATSTPKERTFYRTIEQAKKIS